MTADREGPYAALRTKMEALAADLEKHLTSKRREEVRDVPEQRSEGSGSGEGVRDLIAWLGVLVTLGWLWANRRTRRVR
ncbi:hypothetical protein ACWEIJ_33620 [Lentzea sp. NPDC004789]